jgi:alpha-amylase
MLIISLACPFQEVVDGIFNYPVYWPVYNGFSNSSQSLAPIAPAVLSLNTSHCADTSILGTFFENHDLTRFWNQTSDLTLGKNAVTFQILSEGIPFVYAGFETGQSGAYPNYNRDPMWPNQWKPTEMHTYISILNKLRNGVINKDADAFLKGGMNFLYSGGNALAFKRGPVIVFVTNAGSNGADVTVVTTDTGLSSGTELIDALSNSTVSVGTGGVVSVTLKKGMPMAFYPKADWANVALTTKVDAVSGSSPTPIASATPSGTSKSSTSSTSIATRIIGGRILQWKALTGVAAAFVIGLGVL